MRAAVALAPIFSRGVLFCLAIFCAGLLAPGVALAEPLRIQGSSVVAQALLLAAPTLKKEHGIDVKILPEGGSTAAIQVVGSNGADVAMTTRPLAADDRSAGKQQDHR